MNKVIIERGSPGSRYWADIWQHRELLFLLSWRDILVRYKQTVIGVAWGVIRPLLTIIVFTLIFGRIAKLPTEGDVPYAILVFAGMLPWQFFANALSDASGSVVGSATLISKTYFPRLIVPVSAVMVCFVDFLVSFVILAGLLAWYHVFPGWRLLLLPAFIALMVFCTLGPSLWLAALNVRYRDFRYVIPFVVQFGMYISPVGFTSAVIPEQWRLLYSLNPMVGVIDSFRWAICGSKDFYWPGLVVSLAASSVMLLVGFRYFRRAERRFADVI